MAKEITLRDMMQLSRLGLPVYILEGDTKERLIIAGICSQIYHILDNSLLSCRVLAIDADHPSYKGLCIFLREELVECQNSKA